MTSPFEELANLDKLIHEPARLAILTALSACESADFIALRRLTGLSDGNLSIQLSKLEEAKLVGLQNNLLAKSQTPKRGSQKRVWRQFSVIGINWTAFEKMQKPGKKTRSKNSSSSNRLIPKFRICN